MLDDRKLQSNDESKPMVGFGQREIVLWARRMQPQTRKLGARIEMDAALRLYRTSAG